jgi:hypothetical protein
MFPVAHGHTRAIARVTLQLRVSGIGFRLRNYVFDRLERPPAACDTERRLSVWRVVLSVIGAILDGNGVPGKHLNRPVFNTELRSDNGMLDCASAGYIPLVPQRPRLGTEIPGRHLPVPHTKARTELPFRWTDLHILYKTGEET